MWSRARPVCGVWAFVASGGERIDEPTSNESHGARCSGLEADRLLRAPPAYLRKILANAPAAASAPTITRNSVGTEGEAGRIAGAAIGAAAEGIDEFGVALESAGSGVEDFVVSGFV